MTLRTKLGYTAAAGTVLMAVLVPFVLYGLFSKGVVAMGLHVDEKYSGGPTVRMVQKDGYSIAIHRQVNPHMLESERPFVQMDWRPVKALPGHVSDLVDIDGDGQPDVHVSFDVPTDPKAQVHADVVALNLHYEGLRDPGRETFSRLAVRVDDAIVVRDPVKP